ncbi:modification methylase [Olavius sp. associated proteobacterium Delta 1]|nr:modification methylase [Olavius sp. associated proteobacterium Delta 1]
MRSTHKIYFNSSANMRAIPSSSVHLVVTSPPYPMIEMWDDMFVHQNNSIRNALKKGDGLKAFELMHKILDQVWQELYRILKNGGIACINIGDATRTVGDNFMLYANHSRILGSLIKAGFSALPLILWRKPTNAPNKFMGSGMLPAGAYVTLEHEYILILRKGSKREFKSTQEKQTRRESALFWEERNSWFSDVWLGLVGTQQKLKKNATRLRSGAFPFELAYRLVNMYSTKGDTVVDPFLGTGTTMWSAMASGRNCIGFEIETGFGEIIKANKGTVMALSNERIQQRIYDHLAYVESRSADKGKFKYTNRNYKFPIMTRQEVELFINPLESVKQAGENTLEVEYVDTPDHEFDGDWQQLMPAASKKSKSGQLQLF